MRSAGDGITMSLSVTDFGVFHEGCGPSGPSGPSGRGCCVHYVHYVHYAHYMHYVHCEWGQMTEWIRSEWGLIRTVRDFDCFR